MYENPGGRSPRPFADAHDCVSLALVRRWALQIRNAFQRNTASIMKGLDFGFIWWIETVNQLNRKKL